MDLEDLGLVVVEDFFSRIVDVVSVCVDVFTRWQVLDLLELTHRLR